MKSTSFAKRGPRGPYRLDRRADRMTETRLRIIQAAVKLHAQVGPLATTVAAIAERAGVGRPTVYAHFPDEQTLFAACTEHYFGLHPPPDAAAWIREPDPHRRLVAGLNELYGYWADIEPMASAVLRDHRAAPARVGQGFVDFMAGCRDRLAEGWPVPDAEGRRVRAAIGHAVHFETWRSLVGDEQLSRGEAVSVVVGMVIATAGGAPPTR